MSIAKTLSLALAVSLGGAASAEELLQATLYKMPYCDCCEGHADYLRQHGFDVEIKEVEDLTRNCSPPVLAWFFHADLGGFVRFDKGLCD